MKLYTEIELRKHLYNHDERFFKELTSIELPSDEEIVVNACKNPIVDDFMNDRQIGFVKGCKWMKEQILNQNK